MKKQAASPSAMNSRRGNVSDDPQTIRRRISRLNPDELLLNIPIDLIIEIFSKLPLKSIARCRCVSKQWAAVLRRSDFTELFLAKSLARPRLLFAREEYSKVTFFSSPRPQNPHENFSTLATVDHHMSVPFESVQNISGCVNGYVCISENRMSKERETEEEELVYVICNPSTGQCLTLPKMNTTRKATASRCFLGYDPIEKQHKVLATIMVNKSVVEHQVLTLRGNENLTWRMTECGIQHFFPGLDDVCINGVLYYNAEAAGASSVGHMIVCFDIRSEKFSFVKASKSESPYSTLLDFQGKLASISPQPDPFDLGQTSTSFEMWILEDPEKHEWSKRIFNLPPMWKDVVAAGEDLYFVGATDTNEFVISLAFPFNLSHFYCYNFVKESITRVETQGLGAFETGSVVFTVLDHVEDVKLM